MDEPQALSSILIDDSWTTHEKFAGKDHGLGDFEFDHRPAIFAQVHDYLNKTDRVRAILDHALEHLVSWNVGGIKEEKGKGAKISEANLRLLPHPALLYIVNRINGYAAKVEGDAAKN